MSNTRRRMQGVVTKAKLEKTVTVQIDRTYRHRLYGKVMRSSNHYLAHDEIGAGLGDLVVIVESRPISKRKRWTIETIIRRATEAEAAAETEVIEHGDETPEVVGTSAAEEAVEEA